MVSNLSAGVPETRGKWESNKWFFASSKIIMLILILTTT